ncbi:MAG: ATP-binding protein [Spirochaetota bacterium]|nr:ATP-binding protein [Spirochaetota bacterium]
MNNVNIDEFHDLDIVILCGLPASGKTHIARKLFQDTDRMRINRGGLRKALYTMTHFGDEWKESYFNNDDEVLVKHVERRILEHYLQNKRKVLIDNTSVTKVSRKTYITVAKKMNRSIGVIFVNSPVEKCMERNRAREDKLPEMVISNLNTNKEMPTTDEGFDLIHSVNN